MGTDLTPEWTLDSSHTLFVREQGDASPASTITYVADGKDALRPVVPGRDYVLSALVATHRCTAEVALAFRDMGARVVSRDSDHVPAGVRGGRDRADYHYSRVAATCPEGAVALSVSIIKGPTLDGGRDSFLFVADVSVGSPGAILPDAVGDESMRAAVAGWLSPRLIDLPIPGDLLDGRPHQVRVTWADLPIAGSPIVLEVTRTYEGAIEDADALGITGWLRCREDPMYATEVSLEIDGAVVAGAKPGLKRVEGYSFELSPPAGLADGKPHHVLVRAVPDGSVIDARTQIVGPRRRDVPTRSPRTDAQLRATVEDLRNALAESEERRTQIEQASRDAVDSGSPRVASSSRKPRAAVVAWDVGHNPAGRAFVLYELLKTHWSVDLIGPSWERYGNGLWAPLRNMGLSLRSWPCRDIGDYAAVALVESEWSSYDLVVVSKPRLPSMFMGMAIKAASGCPLVIDVDDEELAFVGGGAPIAIDELSARASEALSEPWGSLATRYAVGLVPSAADAVTVSNVALQRRYGGLIVRHARDENEFVINEQTRTATRRELGIDDDEFAMLFVGTPREHKGILSVAEALHEMNDPGFSFHIIGDYPDRGLRRKVEGFDRARIRSHPGRSFRRLPQTLSAADAVPLLQDPGHPATEFQFPAKLADATALGITVLVTDVPPVADLRTAAGVRFTDGSSLAHDLSELREHRSRDDRRRTREMFLGEFSYEVNRSRLQLAVQAAEAASRPLPADYEELRAIVLSQSDSIARQRQAMTTPTASRRPLAPSRSGSSPRDVVVFWKQNDTGLYGRRPEMLVKYMLASKRVANVLYFDAPIGVDELSEFTRQTMQDGRSQDALVLRNTLARWRGQLDGPRLKQRVFIHGGAKQKRLVGQSLPSLEEYPAFVRSSLKAAGMDSSRLLAWVCPVVWDFPRVHEAVRFGGVIADLIDDQRQWPSNPLYRARVDQAYDDVIALTDLLFTNCQPVADAFAPYGKVATVVPNGAEERNLTGLSSPPSLSRRKRPFIGYVGNMRDRVNWPLLDSIAAMRPDWTFVLAGPTDGRPEALALSRRPNVVMPGVVEYSELPTYLAAFDVAIVPHIRSPLTESMNPLKVYNYVAAGLPIVATELPNLDDMVAFIDIAETPTGFTAAIERALDQRKNDAHRVRPPQLPVAADWSSRVTAILDVIDEEFT